MNWWDLTTSWFWKHPWVEGDSINRCFLTSMGNPIVEIRWSYNCLIPTMGFPILVRQHLHIEPGPRLVRGMVHVWTYMQWCICGPLFQISQFNKIWCVNAKEIYFLCINLLVWGTRVADLMIPKFKSWRPNGAYINELSHHCFRYQLHACSATSYYLNQCWFIVNWTFRNRLHWNFNQNSNIFICNTVFANVVGKKAAILSQPQCINSSPPSATYMSQWIGSALVRLMACRLFGAKPLSKPMLGFFFFFFLFYMPCSMNNLLYRLLSTWWGPLGRSETAFTNTSDIIAWPMVTNDSV